MAFSMTDEVCIFLYSCLAGVLIMLFYDIVSIAGKKRTCSIFLCNVCDGIFILVACTIMIFINFSVSNGIVRSFEFVGAALGAFFYKLTVSKLLTAILMKLTDFFTAFFKFFFKILLTPIRIMYKMINECIIVLFRPVVRVLKRIFSHYVFRIRASLKTAGKAIKKT